MAAASVDEGISLAAGLFLRGIEASQRDEGRRGVDLQRAAILADPTCGWMGAEVMPRLASRELSLSGAVAGHLVRASQMARGGAPAEKAVSRWRGDYLNRLYQMGRSSPTMDSSGGWERELLAMRARGREVPRIDQLLANLYHRAERYSDAVRCYEQLLRAKPRESVCRLDLVRILVWMRDLERAAEVLKADPDGGIVRDKANFYRLRIIFHLICQIGGGAVAADVAADLLDQPQFSDVVRSSLAANQATIDWLSDTCSNLPPLRDVADDLRAARAGAAIRKIHANVRDQTVSKETWERLVSKGPDVGHPVSHVVNPFFHLWAHAALTRDTQGEWQSEETISKSDSAEEISTNYPVWLSYPDRARHVLRSFLMSRPRPPKVLDLACGRGEWLRFMAETCGLPLSQLHGIELHASRLAGAVEMLRQHFTPDMTRDELNQSLERQLAVGDLLKLRAEDIRARHGRIDLITMMAVTPVFNDAQLDRFMGLLAEIAPTHILVVTQTKRWDLNHGRPDEDDWFARHGFVVERQEWTGTSSLQDPVNGKFLPQKYWPNRRVTIYRRAS